MKTESVRSTIQRSIDQLYEASDELSGKKDKSEVDYSLSDGKDRCGNCEHYEVERKNGCTEVKGFIEDAYWCEEYESGGTKEGKGAEEDEGAEVKTDTDAE